MSVLTFGVVTAVCWGGLLLALTRGAYVVPVNHIADIIKKAALLSVSVGLPTAFLLALGAGQLTHLLPLVDRLRAAGWAAIVAMPYYSMLISVGVVEYSGGRWPRNPGGAVRLLGQLTILGVSVFAAAITLGILVSTAGPFMGL